MRKNEKKKEVVKIEENYNFNIDKKANKYYNLINRKDIAKFTYEDYLKCLEDRKHKNNNMIEEERADYQVVNNKKVSHEHDKTYRKLLYNREDAAHIINEALKLHENDKIKSEEIEKYNSSFITNQLKSKESDIVYKLKQKDIFFLIEHQSKVDYSMPYRIEEYRLEIIKSAIDVRKVKTKGYELPVVFPIVVYTGKEKWTVKTHLNQIEEERFKNVKNVKYNLIDINQCEEEKLLKSNYFIDKIFLIEKTKNVKELTKTLEKVITQIKKKEERKDLINIMMATLGQKLGEETLQEMIDKVKGDEEDMLAAMEMVMKEGKKDLINKVMMVLGENLEKETIRKIKKKMQGEEEDVLVAIEMLKRGGIEEGRSEIIINMLKKGIAVEKIEEITGVTKKEIEQAKKTMKCEK